MAKYFCLKQLCCSYIYSSPDTLRIRLNYCYLSEAIQDGVELCFVFPSVHSVLETILPEIVLRDERYHRAGRL